MVYLNQAKPRKLNNQIGWWRQVNVFLYTGCWSPKKKDPEQVELALAIVVEEASQRWHQKQAPGSIAVAKKRPAAAVVVVAVAEKVVGKVVVFAQK
ncbi:hypothetical protein OGAPHI_004224 [Ogataea philodendri]|uniref:Uncharacterized protein n=1 Tax=Ogataea philodendri TaxID=1378263 RepID=A0A9P8T5E8_9ASCO|nr:uncharacterized protein OGAPHI_004224 [Ogataea philodendri]KAH3666035.1 hypothetical protein OGAPHI_004224 [Ogataea philodendri]